MILFCQLVLRFDDPLLQRVISLINKKTRHYIIVLAVVLFYLILKLVIFKSFKFSPRHPLSILMPSEFLLFAHNVSRVNHIYIEKMQLRFMKCLIFGIWRLRKYKNCVLPLTWTNYNTKVKSPVVFWRKVAKPWKKYHFIKKKLCSCF